MQSKSRFVFPLALILLLVFSGSFFLQQCKPGTQKSGDQPNAYVGDQACKSCHNTEYHEWLKSDHFMAMQPATDSFVKGNFNNVVYNADGVTSRFFKKEGKFFINTEGEDGANHDFEVKYIFGYYPLQQYLVEFPGGRMQATRLSWDSKSNKWFHQYAGQEIPAHDWLHWTGNSQNWNTMCASCHSTNLQKNYNIETDSYQTTFNSINVSCETCHGPGKLHVDYINAEDYKEGKKIAGSLLHLAKKSGQISEINTCAPCHARKADISASVLQTGEILDNHIPEIPDTEHFYADGQIKDEDYNYTSFLQSKMFRRGVKCSNCHNPHSGKLVIPGNGTCLSCHAKTYDEPSHTFHAAGTEASTCVSCHLPSKVYMGNDKRHDHSFRVPRPDLTVKYQTPNTCNACHTDKTPAWAAAAISKWYGPVRKYHFADDLVPGSRQDENSEAHLIKLLGDTAVPGIVKAAAAKYLQGLPTQNASLALIRSLRNPDALVRYHALKSLDGFPSSSWINEAGPLLKDKARAVRIAAAELYTSLPKEQIPSQYFNDFSAAKNELESYLYYQADFAVGNLMIADYALKKEDYFNGEKFYLRALKKDSMMNYARLNLSTLYNRRGDNQKALAILQDALKVDAKNDRIYYNLALLYHELNNVTEAEKCFAKAVGLNSRNSKVYYNYGLLLNGIKKENEAASVLMKGIAISPNSPELYYALAFVYIQLNNIPKAKQTAQTLKQLDPSNPEYQQLFRNLGVQ